jgi:hypothetical protein
MPIKNMTESESMEIRDRVRRALNSYEATAGADALVLYFKNSEQGPNMGVFKVGSPPNQDAIVGMLLQYAVFHAYHIGVKDGLEQSKL